MTRKHEHRRLALTALALITTLFGCAEPGAGGKVWFKENGTAEERDRLLAAAHVQAQQSHVAPNVGAPDTTQAHRQSEVESTMTYMTAHGWRLVPPSEAKPLRNTAPGSTPTATVVSPVNLDR